MGCVQCTPVAWSQGYIYPGPQVWIRQCPNSSSNCILDILVITTQKQSATMGLLDSCLQNCPIEITQSSYSFPVDHTIQPLPLCNMQQSKLLCSLLLSIKWLPSTVQQLYRGNIFYSMLKQNTQLQNLPAVMDGSATESH